MKKLERKNSDFIFSLIKIFMQTTKKIIYKFTRNESHAKQNYYKHKSNEVEFYIASRS